VRTLLLVLASAFLHALWNAIIKPDRDTRAAAVVVLAVATATTALVAATLGSAAFPDARILATAVAAGLFEAGYFLTLAVALAAAPLGSVYAATRGGAIVLVWPLSIVIFGEALTLPAVIGAALVIGGLALLGLGDKGTRRGAAWAIACAVCIAGYHLCYKRALALDAAPPLLFAVSLAVALPCNVVGLGRRAGPRLRDALLARPVALLAGGVVCASSFVIFLVALRDGGAGVVLTLRNSSIVFAQLFAFMIGERPSRRAVVGALLIVLGAVALAWS
jgi:drug/metabolite transporter (DMT)-like permease